MDIESNPQKIIYIWGFDAQGLSSITGKKEKFSDGHSPSTLVLIIRTASVP